MYWWNTSKLAEDLRDGRIDEKERLKYYLATLVALNLGAQALFCYGGPFGIERLITIAANLAVTIIGVIFCYKQTKTEIMPISSQE